MPLEEFHGNTFVAFVDISGFKALMKNAREAYKALNNFYQIGYDALKLGQNRNGPYRVDGLFISDCGILFTRSNGENHSIGHTNGSRLELECLLKMIESISRKMIESELMLTTSIAYGEFDYHERIEFPGIEKNLLLGNAYLRAYLDNETGKPKLRPGQCRILTDNQMGGFWEDIIRDSGQEPIFGRVRKIHNDSKHIYFYWMLSGEDKIESFNLEYSDTYNLRYRGMLTVLKQFANG